MNVSYQKWPKIPLGEIFKTTSGGTPLSSCKEYYDGGNIPWINSGELNTPFINAAEHFITPIGLKSSSAKMLPVDSVLIAMYGATAGRASLLKIPACVNQAICAVLPSKNYSPLFLKYYLDTIYQHLVDLSSGSARSNLSQEVLQKVKIPFPDLPTQLRIAAILGSIDEKIELNRKKIAELEALAKTIYDYWFVQFDFPDKNGKPYKSSGGKMVWNEQLKREIPEGWEVKPLGEIAIFSNGINYTTENQKGKKYRIVNVRDISAANLFIHGRDLSEITLPSAFAEKYVIPANCILIARSGIPGAIRLIANPQDTLYCGFIIICRPTIADSRPYLTYFMKSLEGSGATHKDSSILNNVSQDMLKRIYIPIPDDVTLLSFKSLMDDLFENIISLQTGIEETTILRDTLLPLLMNGQVEVKE